MVDVDRIVTLIDMDCFYCQVEEKLDERLKGKPIAVVQYNQWKGGGIIAVNYEARARGVTRHMRGDEAKELCPDIELQKVPCTRGKADISKYREAGKDVANVLQEFSPLLERASIDEAYMDITTLVMDRLAFYKTKEMIKSDLLVNTHVLGYDDNINSFISDVFSGGTSSLYCDHGTFDTDRTLKLLVGAIVLNEIRTAVYQKTGFRCSAGLAHNKIMAKLVCGMNKPNKQTILPLHCLPVLFESLPIKKIKSLGGKFGIEVCQKLQITHMKDLMQFSEKDLQKHFDEKNGSWLYNIARGFDNEPVTPRLCPKSIGCCKKFPGVNTITNAPVLNNWLKELAMEIEERMSSDTIENNRLPTQLVVNFNKEISSGKDVSSSRSFNFKKGSKLDGTLFSEIAFELIKKDSKPFFNAGEQGGLMHPIKFLGLTIGKFEDVLASKSKISDFFLQNLDKEDISKDLKTSDVVEERKALSVKFSKQESFFMNYFKNNEGIPSVSNQTEHDSKDSFLLRQKSVRDSDEQCDSDDSIGTIDLEIDTSKQLLDPREEPSLERPGLGDAFSKISHEYDTRNQLTPPIIKPETRQYIYCEQCNRNVLSDEYLTHLDYHLAIALRIEDSNERMRSKPTTSNTVAVSKDHIKGSGSIRQFFVQSPSNDCLDGSQKEMCAECSKYIRLIDFSEHLDYHEAKKLSIEINSNKSKSFHASGVSAKRKMSISPKESKKARKDFRTKSIDSFFK